jgi:uncharacterized protein
MAEQVPVWVLLGKRTGDNNQLLRLAVELGLPFRVLQLRYNSLHLVPPRLLGPTLASLTEATRSEIGPPWPQLILGIGYRSVPVALAIRKLSGGRSKLVRLGNPRLDPGNFDLVITTPQYHVPSAPNVIHLPLGIPAELRIPPTEHERQWLERLPRPHRLLLIGGDTFMWTLRPQEIARAAARSARKDGSLISVSSPRTSPNVVAAVEAATGGPVVTDFPRYSALLADADEIYVTGDSVAMTSDAIATGKPVAIVRPTKTTVGRALHALARAAKRPVPIRDIGRFIDSVVEQRFAGSIEEPRAGRAIDPLGIAVAAVRKLL